MQAVCVMFSPVLHAWFLKHARVSCTSAGIGGNVTTVLPGTEVGNVNKYPFIQCFATIDTSQNGEMQSLGKTKYLIITCTTSVAWEVFYTQGLQLSVGHRWELATLFSNPKLASNLT